VIWYAKLAMAGAYCALVGLGWINDNGMRTYGKALYALAMTALAVAAIAWLVD